MVTIKDGCGCDPCDCDWKQKLKEAYARASVSVNKVGDFDGAIYYPDGSGFVKLPIPRLSEIQQISQNAQDIADLKVADVQLQADINAETTAREEAIAAEASAREVKDTELDADITRIDNTDAEQDQRIRDNADRITTVSNDLIATEATVATHNTEIINLQSQTQTLRKSLVSDVMMTDGTTAGSVQVSIEREDGAVVTSANYKWGRDIGVRLEAGTQAGYIKTVISLSDGTELESNEYKIVEVIESDVYVTAITLVPDMAAGTIGGNISYSNGTTQTINAINVPTAPGVTSAIEALQSRMSAVEQKNTTQDSQISALDGRIKAIEGTPGISQFASGKLGTIAGSTADGRVKAEDDGTGSVNGWNALKQRVTTAEGQIVSAQNDISAIETKNTQQDTAINGLQTSKVNIAQGAANAGKALVVGADGNVSPGDISGGEVWEEVDLNNWPTDWVNGDRIKFIPYRIALGSDPSSWTTKPPSVTISNLNNYTDIKEVIISSNYTYMINIGLSYTTQCFKYTMMSVHTTSNLNNNNFCEVSGCMLNAAGISFNKKQINNTELIKSYIYKMWRLKR